MLGEQDSLKSAFMVEAMDKLGYDVVTIGEREFNYGQQFLLDKPNYDDTEKGKCDTYEFSVNLTVGELQRASIGLKSDGTGASAGWYCDSVELYAQLDGDNNSLLYNRWSSVGWLAKDDPSGLSRVLQFGAPLARRN